MCGKVLDACTSQQIDGKYTHSLPFISAIGPTPLTDNPSIHPFIGLVHCGSVLVLLSPLLSPWRLRERVWRHLADLRLLHLVEDQHIIAALLPVLETPPPFSPPPLPATHPSGVLSAVDNQDNGLLLQGEQQLMGDGQHKPVSRKGSTTNALVRNPSHASSILQYYGRPYFSKYTSATI